MNRVTAAYDLDDDHNRLWVNADLETMPEIVIVKNIREGNEQTSTFTRLSDDADNAREVLTENDRLRELVQDMFKDFANADYELKMRAGRTFMAVTRYEPRLRELGIKVP